MKHSSPISNTKSQIAIFCISLITTKIYCVETLNTKIQNICLKAESSVKSFFGEKQKLPEKFKNFEIKNKISESELKLAIKLLLLDEETRNNFMLSKNNEKKYIQIIMKIIIIISVVLIIDFEIHFILRLLVKKDIFEPSFINFYKISPFYWIFYFILNKQKIKILYNEFLNNRISNKKKYLIFTFVIIIFIIIIIIFVITCFVSNQNDNSTEVSTNVLCASIKFLNEIQNGKQLKKNGSHLIGLKDINLFLNELMENKNEFTKYIVDYNQTYNDINNYLNNWENYLIDIEKNLSDKNSLKYFFYNYPSDSKYIKQISCDFSNPISCKKNLFQTKLIYDYYPYNDNSKILYIFNNNLHENIDILFEKLKIFENYFINSENSLIFLLENQNYINGLSKIESIINIYIHQLLEIDKENIFDKFIYSYLSYVYSFDFILLIFLGLNSLLSLLYIEYYFAKKYVFARVVISITFYNVIFIILIFCFIEINMLKKINITFLYIKEISKGIHYFLNDIIEDYGNLFDEENNSYFKNISLIMQFKNTKMNNNLFNYIKYYINNENELKNILNDKILNKNLLTIINNTLNEDIDYKNSKLNCQINNYSEKILKLINEGLKYNTNFVDLTRTGYNGTYLESPINYLTYVNLMTKKTDRDKFNYKEIPCDETWNISNIDPIQGEYEYKPKDLVLCENCNNVCSNDKILLNFMEYTINEIEQRYNHLKNGVYNDTYYELMYYFNATDKLRDKMIFEQLQDLYEMNENLKIIQSNIFNSIKQMGYIAKEIITIYGNIVNKYEKENIYLNYTEFIKNDLYYLQAIIEINFSQKINKEYKIHLHINIMCICVCFILIIFYIFFAKEIKYFRIDNETFHHTKNNIDNESSFEENAGAPQPPIPNFNQINQINVKNQQTNPNLENKINILDINEDKNLKKTKSMTIQNNIFDNDSNKYINNFEDAGKRSVELLDTRKNLIVYNKKKNTSVTRFNESRNDESGLGLTKGLILENQKGKIDTINKDSKKYLNEEVIKIQNKKLLDKDK